MLLIIIFIKLEYVRNIILIIKYVKIKYKTE